MKINKYKYLIIIQRVINKEWIKEIQRKQAEDNLLNTFDFFKARLSQKED